MASEAAGGLRGVVARNRGLLFPVLIVTSVLVIVAPLPPLLMDMLLACNVTAAVIILLTTIYVDRPLDFSVFPAILLGTTLARLVLNVASTRLILTRGASHGTSAAGGVIEAFGKFVAGGQIAIGLTIFIILIAIQFLVITKGATRISEVAARFALDGMPGKQMAIDADLNAGLITSEQAKQRREEITQQADFYGAMDGASKFVRGDAVASIVITLINIIAGLYFGMVEHGMGFRQAAEVFTTLTIGDGLVTQVPAFLISLAAGLIVTRTSSSSNLPKDVVGQLFRHPEALILAGVFLLALSFTGLPALPMLMLASGCGFAGWSLFRGKKDAQIAQEKQAVEETQQRPDPKPEDHLFVDPLELDLGVGLLQLADPSKGGDLLDRVTRVRHMIAQDLGLIMPKVRIRDNIGIGHQQYQIKIRNVPLAWGESRVNALLAVDTGITAGDIPGVDTVDPLMNRPAKWIDESLQDRAQMLGYMVATPAEAITTHLTDVVRNHGHELLSRQQVHELIENLKQTAPKVVEELVPDMMRPAQVHQVLVKLLKERVPIRDLETILETLGQFADRIKNLDILTEYVRHALARTICQQYRDKNHVLHVVTIDPALEDILSAGFEFNETGLNVKLSPQIAEQVTRELVEQLKHLMTRGRPMVLLCTPPHVRIGMKQITQDALPKLAVLSLAEVSTDTKVESVGTVGSAMLQGVGVGTGI